MESIGEPTLLVMISTLLVDTKDEFSLKLETHLKSYCPQLEILGNVHTPKGATEILVNQKPELVIMDVFAASAISRDRFDGDQQNFETILVLRPQEKEKFDTNTHSIGYLFQPIQLRDLIIVIQHVLTKIQWRKLQFANKNILDQLLTNTPPNDILAIPTIDGIDFLKIEEIIRCEGLQKYTRIYTSEKSDIISSYSIGQFCNMLKAHGFFASHKSHLINLRFIRKFLPEGTLIMRDGSAVPVSRRRKASFIERIKLIKPT